MPSSPREPSRQPRRVFPPILPPHHTSAATIPTPTTMSAARLSLAETRQRLFASVFSPSQSNNPQSSATIPPTPEPPTPSHGYNTRHHVHQLSSPPVDAVALLPSPAVFQAREQQAWETATAFLRLPDGPLPRTVRDWMKIRGEPSPRALAAIRYLMLNNEDGTSQGRENLTEWYTCEVRRHFMRWVRTECEIPRVS